MKVVILFLTLGLIINCHVSAQTNNMTAIAVCAENATNGPIKICQSSNCLTNCSNTVMPGMQTNFIIVSHLNNVFICNYPNGKNVNVAMSFVPLTPNNASIKYKVLPHVAVPVSRHCS